MQRRLSQVGAPAGGWEEDAGALLQGTMALDAPPAKGHCMPGTPCSVRGQIYSTQTHRSKIRDNKVQPPHITVPTGSTLDST